MNILILGESDEPIAEATPVVEMRNIKKSFAAVQALRG